MCLLVVRHIEKMRLQATFEGFNRQRSSRELINDYITIDDLSLLVHWRILWRQTRHRLSADSRVRYQLKLCCVTTLGTFVQSYSRGVHCGV